MGTHRVCRVTGNMQQGTGNENTHRHALERLERNGSDATFAIWQRKDEKWLVLMLGELMSGFVRS